MHDRRRDRRAGLTILELLVVFGLMLLLSTLIVSGFRTYVAEQQFEAGVAEVRSLIREARQRTLAAEGNAAHGVLLGTSSVTALVGPSFNPAGGAATTYNIGSVIISPSLTAGTSTITFARLSGTPSATGTILFTNNRTGATTSFTIVGTGIIE